MELSSSVSKKNAKNADGTYYNNEQGGQTHDYVGVAGAYPDPAGRSNKCEAGNYGDYGCRNGVLTSMEWNAMKTMLDGTSSTIVVGEQSGFVDTRDIRACYHGGWAGRIGTGMGSWGSGITTVRYPINSGFDICDSASGCDDAYDNNTVFNSHHPGGAQCLLGDGAVRFVSETILMDTLLRIASKADKQVAENF